MAVFIYLFTRQSYFLDKHDGRKMPNAKYENFSRLPLWVGLSEAQVIKL